MLTLSDTLLFGVNSRRALGRGPVRRPTHALRHKQSCRPGGHTNWDHRFSRQIVERCGLNPTCFAVVTMIFRLVKSSASCNFTVGGMCESVDPEVHGMTFRDVSTFEPGGWFDAGDGRIRSTA